MPIKLATLTTMTASTNRLGGRGETALKRHEVGSGHQVGIGAAKFTT